eukprot:350033-Chlamydomonas_euryale.AAC.2
MSLCAQRGWANLRNRPCCGGSFGKLHSHSNAAPRLQGGEPHVHLEPQRPDGCVGALISAPASARLHPIAANASTHALCLFVSIKAVGGDQGRLSFDQESLNTAGWHGQSAQTTATHTAGFHRILWGRPDRMVFIPWALYGRAVWWDPWAVQALEQAVKRQVVGECY